MVLSFTWYVLHIHCFNFLFLSCLFDVIKCTNSDVVWPKNAYVYTMGWLMVGFLLLSRKVSVFSLLNEPIFQNASLIIQYAIDMQLLLRIYSKQPIQFNSSLVFVLDSNWISVLNIQSRCFWRMKMYKRHILIESRVSFKLATFTVSSWRSIFFSAIITWKIAHKRHRVFHFSTK